MSEYCLDCWNKQHHTSLSPRQVIQSSPHDLDVCTQCGGVHRIIVRIPPATPIGWLACRYWQLHDRFEK